MLKGKRIFVLEDDFSNLLIIKTILQQNGAEVFTDVWGTSTVVQMKYLGKLDAILLDLMLSRTNMSGYDIFDRIKAEPTLADIPVVLVTAADPDTESLKAKGKGFAGFVSKPLDRQTFAQQIKSALEDEFTW